MKKVIVFVAMAIFIALVVVIAVNYFNVPEHVRNGELESGIDNGVWIDERIGSAITEGKHYITEEDGLDIPYSDDLLRTLETHFGADIEFIGAGAYWGVITENTAVELILNTKENVGQVELWIARAADKAEMESAVATYLRFVNSEVTEETVNSVLQETLPDLHNLKTDEPYIYFGHGVGFAGRVEDNKVVLYIP